jgi:integrase
MKTFTKKSDAIAALPTMKTAVPDKKASTLQKLWSIWSVSPDCASLSASQQGKMRFAWNHLQKIGYLEISSLTVAFIEEWLDDEFDAYYPARDAKVLLSHLYDLAIRRDEVQLNRTKDVRLPIATPVAKRECWDTSEIRAFADAWSAGDRIAGYILIMCYTGMRFGELYALKLSDIHWEESYCVGGEKTAAGRDREIPLHPSILPIVRHLAEGRRHRLLEMNKDAFYTAYHQTLARCGARDLPPQTCRHYFFTAMTSAGVQPGLIAETGGHASYQTTMANYVRTPIAAKVCAVSALPPL